MEYILNKPYPKVNVERPNKKIARMLSHLYASNESELTAIHQYTYQTFVIQNEELSIALKKIAVCEMKHLELLGKLIHLLGEAPIYAEITFDKENYWNGFDVYYDTDIETILEINIEAERKAIYNYHMVLNCIDDIYIKTILERILEDEYLHLNIFEKFYKKELQ